MKPFCVSAGQPAHDPEDGSAGQPAFQSPDSIAQQTDNYCSMYHSKLKAPPAAEYCAVCKQACGYPFGPVRWPLLRLTRGGEECKTARNGAVQPVVNQTGIGNIATRMSSSDVNSTRLHDILIILSQPLSPQCLLRLSAGSRTLQRCATSDDVRVVFMHGSLSTDSSPSSAPSSSSADIGLVCHGCTVLCCAQAQPQQHVFGQLLTVATCYLLLLMILKLSFHKQLPKCVEATSGSSVAGRPRTVPAQYSAPFVP